MNNKKILVAYYSWGGNTAALARTIQSATGADLFIIEPLNAYPENYNACVDQAKTEINAGYRPELKNNISDLQQYDVIFVGTPNWWSTMAPPVATFLSENNMAGKTVVPFVTHGGGREARCFTDMQKLAPDAVFLKGLAVSSGRATGSQTEVEKWLGEIGVK